MIHVVAALLESEGRILLCQRAADKSRALKWEFPGGKIEPGETPEAALIRELREELNVTVSVRRPLADLCWDYPDVSIHLTLFHCRLLRGVPTLLEHQNMVWVPREQVTRYDLASADRALWDQLSF